MTAALAPRESAATASSGHAPVSHHAPRLNGVDAARGLALIGMMVVHVLPDENPSTGGPAWTYVVSAGNASALFALLAGLSIAFMTGRARVRRSAARATIASLLARAAVIGLIGLALGYTDSELATVILPFYAVMFVLAIPLVFLPTWAVGCAGVGLVGVAPMINFLVLPRVPETSESLLNLGFRDVATRPLGLVSELMFSGEFPALIWISYMCFGLFLGRLDLRSTRTASRMLVFGCTFAACAYIASGLLLYNFGGLQKIWETADMASAHQTMELLRFGGDGVLPPTTWWWLAVAEPHSGTPFDVASTMGVAVAVLAVLLLSDHLGRSVPSQLLGWVKSALAAAGKMTLTFYTLHIMFINSVHDTYVPATSLLLQVVAALVLGLAWQASAGRGPLEALTAAVTRRASRLVTRRAYREGRRHD